MMRWFASLLGVVVSLACIGAAGVMNWKYGMSLGREPSDQFLFSAVAGAFDALKVLTPFFLWWAIQNRRVLVVLASGVLLVGCMCSSVIGIAGFAELNRATTTGAVLSKQGTEEGLRDDLARKSAELASLGLVQPAAAIDHELDGLRQDKRWTSTGECKDATATASREFCASYNAKQAALDKAIAAGTIEKEIAELRMNISALAGVAQIDRGDPRAGIVSRLTGWELLRVQTGLSLLFVGLLEFVSTFGIFISLNHGALRRTAAVKTEKEKIARPDPMVRSDIGTAAPPSKRRDVATVTLAPVRDVEAAPTAQRPARRRPLQLIEGNKADGDVAKFAVSQLSPAVGSEVSITALFEKYQDWCAREGFRPASDERFRQLFRGLCELSGFSVAERGDDTYCVNLKLVA